MAESSFYAGDIEGQIKELTDQIGTLIRYQDINVDITNNANVSPFTRYGNVTLPASIDKNNVIGHILKGGSANTSSLVLNSNGFGLACGGSGNATVSIRIWYLTPVS